MNSLVKHLDSLTGLRFVAALGVFVHHVAGKFGLHEISVPLGAIGVSFFFVLSGFILTYVYRDRFAPGELKKGDIKKFYFSRWARIWPLHMVCLLAIVFLFWNTYWVGAKQYEWVLSSHVLLLQSWFPSTKVAFAFNGVAWSVSTELFFYLMFPLLLIGGQRKFWWKYGVVLVLTVLGVFAANALSQSNLASTKLASVDWTRMVHVNPLFRLIEFGAGMATGFIYLNRLESRRNRGLLFDSGVELLAIGLLAGYWTFYLGNGINYQLRTSDWGGPVLGTWVLFTGSFWCSAIVVYVFARSNGLLGRLLSGKPAVFLGEISFAFYMVHFLVIRCALAMDWAASDVPPVCIALACFLISLGLSIVLFKAIEIPAKAGLMKIYAQDWGKVLPSFGAGIWSLARSRAGLLATCLVIGPSIFLTMNHRQVVYTPTIFQIITDSNPAFKRAEFGNQFRLLGVSSNVGDHGLEMKLVWQRTATDESHEQRTVSRFIHICDENDEVVGYGHRQIELFQSSQRGQPFIDEFLIPRKQLAGGTKIGIGLHNRGQGAIKIDRGPRSMNRRRLDILQQNSFAKLIPSASGNATVNAKARSKRDQLKDKLSQNSL